MAIQIVIVDDDFDDREIFSEAAKSVDSTIVCHQFDRSQKLFSFLNKGNLDLCLIALDLNMPQMNGWEILKKLKSTTRFQHIPVMICSTTARPADIERGLSEGAIAVMAKPDSFDDWKLQLKEILSTCEIKLS